MEGAAAAPPHPPAAAAPGRPWSRRSGAPGCGDVSCARGCMAPAGSRGRPRPAAPYAPRPIPGSGAPAAPAPAHRPSARPPHPRPAAPDARQAPYPRGAGPRGALPRMSVPAGSAPGAQGPEHRAGASLLSRPFSLSARSLARSLAGGARARSLAHPPQSSPLPASHLAADAGAADARIYKVSGHRDVDARRPASSAQPIRAVRHLKGRCHDRSLCVGPAGRRCQPRLLRGHFCLGRFSESCLA